MYTFVKTNYNIDTMKIKLKFLPFLIITTVLFSILVSQISCTTDNKNQSSGKLKGEIAISGAFALYPIVVKWAEEFQKIHPEVVIDVVAGATGKGVTDVLSGTVEIGMAGRDLNENELKQGAWALAITKDAVLASGNSKNPVLDELFKKGISKETFVKIYSGQINTWGEVVGNTNTAKLEIYKRSDAGGVTESWSKFLGLDPDELKGLGIFGDPGVAEAVKKAPNGIGFNNTLYVYDANTRLPYPGITPLPIDVNANGMIDSNENVYNNLDTLIHAIKEGRLPSPPVRFLYLFTKNKPSNEITIAFMKWVISDGQKYCNESGYINLPQNILDRELKKFD